MLATVQDCGMKYYSAVLYKFKAFFNLPASSVGENLLSHLI